MSINYRDNMTNTQAEVMAKFITSEAGVNLNPPKFEMHEKIAKDC